MSEANPHPSPAIEGHEASPVLVVVPSVGGRVEGDQLRFDQKAMTGWQAYAEAWPGATRFVLRAAREDELGGAGRYPLADLPGEVKVIDADGRVPDEALVGAAVVLAAGDNHRDLPLAAQARRLGTPLCYVIEYTLETRLRIAALERRSFLARFKSMLWLIATERKRRAAFRQARALQSNGTPAAQAFRRLVPDILTYFDTRLTGDMAATDAELDARAAAIRAGGPLRLAFTGRLERMKGAHHLVPLARALIARGVPFQLDIYGAGSVADEIRKALANRAAGGEVLGRHLFIHDPQPFATALIPWLKRSVDLFVCCHVQGDPSCTYLETLGCGVPIIGFANEAWRGLLERADLGWQVPMGNTAAMADRVAQLAADRSALIEKMRGCRDFSLAHSFEHEFAARVAQLRRIAAIGEGEEA